MDMFKKIPVREQDPQVRATNFEEVCLGYNEEEAKLEASRCLNCKNARCVQGCPVNINIPAFVEQVKNGDFKKASEIIGIKFIDHIIISSNSYYSFYENKIM